MAETKAEQDNVGESLEDDEIKGTKVDKENTSNICGTISFMKKVYLTMFQIITKIEPSVTFSSMILIH